jgi:hypothetical protein
MTHVAASTGTDGYDPAGVIGSPIPGYTDDELATELRPEAPPSRVVTVLTRVLAALALVSVGMVGGVLLQQHFGTASSATSNGTLPGGGFGGFGGGFGGGGFGGGNGGPPAGFQPPAGAPGGG